MLRDRVLNLGVRMPPKIRPNEFHLPLLDESDFDIGVYPTEVSDMLDGCEVLKNPALQSHLARICIEKTKLCLFLGRVFDTLYTSSNPKLGTTTEVTLILTPKIDGAKPDEVFDLGQRLQSWLQSLPSDLSYQNSTELQLGAGLEITFVHHSLLLMFYHTIMCTFYRPHLLSSLPLPSPVQDLTRQRMNYATTMITRQLEDIHTYGLLHFMPSCSVTFLLTAAVNCLVEYKTSRDEECRKRHRRRFEDCLCYLRPIKPIHIYAKYAEIFLDSAAHLAGITEAPGAAYTANITVRGGRPESTDEGVLGPWAVAHTPDELDHSLLERPDNFQASPQLPLIYYTQRLSSMVTCTRMEVILTFMMNIRNPTLEMICPH